MKKTNRMTLLALIIAIEVLMAVVPFLGYIPLGIINATTLHIPVIIAGILLGKKEGGIVGFIFGLTSMLKNTFQPGLTSFLFSPFITIGGISGNWQSLIIAFIPRILIGYLAGLIYETLVKKEVNDTLSTAIAACLGSLLNTAMVMSLIYLLFGSAYAQALGIAYSSLVKFIMAVVTTNGIAEALVATIIVTAVVKAGKKVIKL